MTLGGGNGSRGQAINLILAACLTAIIVGLGSYVAFTQNAVSRSEMHDYVQTQSPFAHEQALFDQMQITLDRLDTHVTKLEVSEQHQNDEIAQLNLELKLLRSHR